MTDTSSTMSQGGGGQDAGRDAERPSFESWWKRSKEALRERKIKFVQAANQQQAKEQDGSSSAQTSQEKAKARRAQVRRAQVEHRQRKANYVKQLEIDVARIRDMINAAQMETRVLQAENDAIRAKLAVGPGSAEMPALSSEGLLDDTDMTGFLDDIQLGGNLDDITLSLGLDEAMNTPVYRISSTPTTTNHPFNTYLNNLDQTEGPTPFYPFSHLTPEQAQRVVNFILALEHICWDHFHQIDFQPDVAEPIGTETGHTLMASSLALRTAPASVFEAMSARPGPAQQQPPGDPVAPLAASSEAGVPQPPQLSWQGSGLTLESLYGLASSVNPSDLDLAPVQAWFELAARYPPEILLRKDVEDRLKKEFVGVVKCPHYGAAIERGAFESIVARVLDPEVLRLAGIGEG